jgi:WD40 repeat protein
VATAAAEPRRAGPTRVAGAVRFWHSENGAPLAEPSGGHWRGVVQELDISPDGTLAASAGSDGVVGIWHVAGGFRVHALRGHGAAVSSVRFDPRRPRLYSLSEDGTLRVWNTDDFDQHWVVPTGQRRAGALAVSPDGSMLAMCWRAQAPVLLWDALKLSERDRLILPPPRHGEDRALAFAPAGDKLTVAGNDAIRTWDLDTMQVILEVDLANSTALAVSPHDATLAIAHWNPATHQSISLCDAQTGNTVAPLFGHHLPVTALCFFPDGKTLASGSRDGVVILWEL